MQYIGCSGRCVSGANVILGILRERLRRERKRNRGREREELREGGDRPGSEVCNVLDVIHL